EFLGKILFLQNYSIELAKLLVSGADIWLNTPTRPLEASGTSGEKAVMNGTLHFSVLDGWWVEGYQPEAGWALTNERTYDNQEFQDDLDAEIIYSIFEDEVLPSYYNRDKNGIPTEWVKYIKNNIAHVSPKFTTRRMIDDYQTRFYNKLYERSKQVLKKDYDMATQIAHWKRRMMHEWDSIDVLDIKIYEDPSETIEAGTVYQGHVVMDLKNIKQERVGVELIVTENFKELVIRQDFELSKIDKSRAVYTIGVTIDQPGTFQYGIRVFPKHELLPHRQDFAHIRWI
ncbi:MAG: alpha-glucan family phosphorylase, partial [Bacteroidales bacterium]|nr:alpha-glucan family phosphorylase [Bacteroidales bacterium]